MKNAKIVFMRPTIEGKDPLYKRMSNETHSYKRRSNMMNFNSRKSKKIVSAVIIVIVILAMLVPMLSYVL